MKLPRRKFLHGAVAAAALPAFASGARAQAYPARPIMIVVPYAPGGPTDVIARILADRMRVALAQTVIVENVAGANGTIGVGRVARAAPDGYTLSIGHWSTHVVNGALYQLNYDLLNDFAPISLIATNSYLIVAKNAVPADDLKGFIAWLKANPDKASEGTAGAGSPQHIGGVFFQKATGTKFQFVPYRGAAPAMQDLLAGQVDLIVDDPTDCLQHVRAGRIKAFAVTAKTRLAAAPDIPTVDEAGLPGFYFSRWHALWAPKGTPAEIIRRLNAAVVDGLADPTVRARLNDLAQEIFPREQQTPEALGAWQKAEIEKWWPIIKAADIKVE
jgi:tripartite-type tricarboxylate transporter receptor subunit TctC